MPNNYVLIPSLELNPEPTQTVAFTNKAELQGLLEVIDTREWLAVDIETAGLYPLYHRDWLKQSWGPGQEIVMIGMYQPATGAVCIDLRGSYAGCLLDLCQHLIDTKAPLVFFNGYFDLMSIAQCLWPDLQQTEWTGLNHVSDGYFLFKILATEGFTGQSHSLKTAQVDILGWDARGDAELSAWLKANKLTKADMHQAPVEMLGHYCALDCLSTWHLVKHLTQVASRWPAIQVVLEAFLAEVRCLIQNYRSGIPVDIEAMRTYADAQTPIIEDLQRQFCEHPKVKPILERDRKLWEADNPPPAQFKKSRVLTEPKQYTKGGALTASWLKWKAKMENFQPPPETAQWARYQAKKARWDEETKRLGAPKEFFNIDSSDQLKRLMYEDLGYPVLATRKNKKTGEENPTVGKDAYPGFDDLGRLLNKRRKAVQRKSMSISWLENTNPRTGLLHPLFKAPGTTTTRLSGSGGVNAQNPVKEKDFMLCIREPDPDNWVWVDADFVALESVLMAYISQDKGYMSIYGPDAIAEDIYLFFGGAVPGIKEEFARCGYTPGCGDKEAIKRAKKECKDLRNIAKIAVLSLSYGSGAKKLYQTLKLKGVQVAGKPITYDQVKVIFDMYWKVFAGIKSYNTWCEKCWEKTGGYVLAPFGIPVAACDNKVYKLANHCIQMTGHLFTMLWIQELEKLMDEAQLEWYPVVQDFHDEALLRVRYTGRTKDEVVELCSRNFKQAIENVNKKVCGPGAIPMKVSPDSGFNLAHFKCEE